MPACGSSNNTDCEPTDLVREATITVDKVDDVVTNVLPGGTFSYSLSVTNNGPSTVSDVVLDDDLPVGLSVLSVSGGVGWSCNSSDPVHCVRAGVLAVGQTSSLVTVSVKLSSAFAGSEVLNTADGVALVDDKGTVSTADDVLATDSDDERTPVIATVDLC